MMKKDIIGGTDGLASGRKKESPCLIRIGFCLIAFLLFLRVLLPYTSKASMIWFSTPVSKGFTRQEYTLAVGERITLRVNAVNVRVSYSSSDFKVASVNQNGTVKAKRTGMAIIYGTYQQTTITCRIRVVDE